MDDAPLINTWLRTPDAPHWGPLEAVARLSRSTDALPSIEEADFMYMAYVESRRRRLRIHLYKHIDTRRYLNLDDAGHAYQYWGPVDLDVDDEDDSDHGGDTGGVYSVHHTLRDALQVVVDDLMWMRP
jgi:hypothetical protein